jgi:hypothetical protein
LFLFIAAASYFTIAHFVKLEIKKSEKSRQLANPFCVMGLSWLEMAIHWLDYVVFQIRKV